MSDAASDLRDAYAVLEVVEGASEGVVKLAFKARALQTHPDSGGSKAEFQRVEAAMMLIEEAGFPPARSGAAAKGGAPTLRTCTACGRANKVARGVTGVRCGACGQRFFWGRGLRDEVLSLWGQIEVFSGGYLNFEEVASKAPVTVKDLHRARRVRNDHAHGREVNDDDARGAYRTLRVVVDALVTKPQEGSEAREQQARAREARERAARAAQEREAREAQEREASERQARAARAAQEREARAREAQEREARAREAQERESREREARARAARERDSREQEATERQAAARATQERHAREREARALAAKESAARTRGAAIRVGAIVLVATLLVWGCSRLLMPNPSTRQVDSIGARATGESPVVSATSPSPPSQQTLPPSATEAETTTTKQQAIPAESSTAPAVTSTAKPSPTTAAVTSSAPPSRPATTASVTSSTSEYVRVRSALIEVSPTAVRKGYSLADAPVVQWKVEGNQVRATITCSTCSFFADGLTGSNRGFCPTGFGVDPPKVCKADAGTYDLVLTVTSMYGEVLHRETATVVLTE